MKIHKKKAHPPECDICNKKFRKDSQVIIHKKRFHGKKCDLCNETFSKKYQLKEHKKVAHNEVKKCELCSETFSKVYQLVEHMKNAHNELQPYLCKICHKKFAQQRNLNRHMGKSTRLKGL